MKFGSIDFFDIWSNWSQGTPDIIWVFSFTAFKRVLGDTLLWSNALVCFIQIPLIQRQGHGSLTANVRVRWGGDPRVPEAGPSTYPLFWVFIQHPLQQIFQSMWVLIKLRWECEFFLLDFPDNFLVVLRLKGSVPADHFVKHDSGGPDVNWPSISTWKHLRCSVEQGASNRP